MGCLGLLRRAAVCPRSAPRTCAAEVPAVRAGADEADEADDQDPCENVASWSFHAS